MNICIIPARGGSKRVKRKNIMDIAGKPLIAYSIEKALESKLFDAVYVNSEDEEILRVSEQYGAKGYRRPDELSGDKVFIIDVLKQMLETLGATDEWTVGIMLATSPLREVEDIRGAYELYLQKGAEIPVVSVTTYETPIQLAQYSDDDGRLTAVFPDDYKKSTRSTDHKTVYKYNEGIIFNSYGRLKTQKNLIGERPVPYPMPPERSILIDYPYQFELIKLILENKKGNDGENK